MSIYVPYVYRFNQISTGMWYIGVRFAKGCHPDDGYNSSSKTVRPLVESCPDEWLKEIIATGSKEAMVALERFILAELNAARNPMSFNRTNASGERFYRFGPHTEETKRKMSESHTGKKRSPRTEQHRLRLSNALKDKKRGPRGPYGPRGPHSEEHRRKLSNAAKRRWAINRQSLE